MSDSPDAVPVVQIVTPVVKGSPHGFTEINFSDFNAEIHTLYEKAAAVVEKVEAAVVGEVKKVVAENLSPLPAPPVVVPEAAKPAGWGAPPSA